MAETQDKLKSAALRALLESGEFSVEQREAIAAAVAAGVLAFRDIMLENVEQRQRELKENERESEGH